MKRWFAEAVIYKRETAEIVIHVILYDIKGRSLTASRIVPSRTTNNKPETGRITEDFCLQLLKKHRKKVDVLHLTIFGRKTFLFPYNEDATIFPLRTRKMTCK